MSFASHSESCNGEETGSTCSVNFIESYSGEDTGSSCYVSYCEPQWVIVLKRLFWKQLFNELLRASMSHTMVKRLEATVLQATASLSESCNGEATGTS